MKCCEICGVAIPTPSEDDICKFCKEDILMDNCEQGKCSHEECQIGAISSRMGDCEGSQPSPTRQNNNEARKM